MRRAPSTPPELPGYAAHGLLGSGGFADVFLYEQKLPRRKVAVKVLLAEGLGRDTKAQFVAEANLMAQLSAHPFIVTIFHADVSADGRPYFVMEYCSGPSLAERYKRQPLSIEDALRTGVRLAGAIATAHAAGILHRDIKPANVLTNDYGWPALTDFGISSNLEGELPVHTVTASDLASGTASGPSAVGMSVPWSPPEMFEDDPRPDTRSDVFSLAATVHTLIAGRTPFEIPGRSNGSLDLIGRIERGAITPMDRSDVPRSLIAVLAKGMASRRDDRYPSAVEFARALQRVELELGYAATNIEVPNLASAREEAEPDDDDATRARSVRTVDAQAPQAPRTPPRDEDATRARSPQQIQAQAPVVPASGALVDDGTVVRRPGAVEVPDSTIVRPSGAGGAPSPHATTAPDSTIVRPVGHGAHAGAGAPAGAVGTLGASPEASGAPRRNRVGLIVAIVAGVVVAAVIGIAIAMSGSLVRPIAVETTGPGGENAVVGQSIPVPVVSSGVASADGSSVTFEVSHAEPEADDRYRWRLSDGSGDPQVSTGSTITVEGTSSGIRTCIEVQVQRGSKLSESATGCTP
ncbi:serine/threonine protein kinase [Agromyces hippuratus]|uniref:non-specific serine/threonine protein kinase n=1 Tax=Agromyces hippuratus TaxID=286438 RepID=A0A852X2U1_9MICO|nr:serine/threonine-protein kinase [Agromyces hippuratus]NYG20385.1 serine/threonine protein kinase [Agromyces hippuratus]